MKVIAYCSPFVPGEWIAAHGFQPSRLNPGAAGSGRKGNGAGVGEAPGAGVCPFAHDFAQALLGHSETPPPDAAVFATTCDQMRRIAQLVADRLPVFLMNVPATWQTPAARTLFREELQRLSRFLVAMGGIAPMPEALVHTTLDWRSTQEAPAPEPSPAAHSGDSRTRRIALAGGPLRPQDQWIRDHLTQHGARIVLDATEFGERGRPAPLDPQRLAADPFAELTRSYFHTIPDAFRRPDTLLHQYLQQRVQASQAQALLLVRPVWCDQWHAQGTRLRQSLPVPVLEIDLGPDDHGQSRLRSRLDALLEALP
jgi:benzoyl-CoA reductase/2-hydroxyglutaryl-CoA dehydratase subunit BcrC/BadD/HgdB